MSLKTLTKKSRDSQSRAPDSVQYSSLAAQMETNLQTHILGVWFPRAVDLQRGGFHQNFSESWTRADGEERSIVHQARQTWLATEAVQHDLQRHDNWLQFARHGFNFLQSQLWDESEGGFFWELDANGAPVEGGEKHVYGQAFALFSLSNYYRATKDERARQLAQKTFDWLQNNAHDSLHGGYDEAFARGGQRLLHSPDATRTRDFIGTPFGFKSANTHLHLLEAFSSWMQVSPSPQVVAQLEELLILLRDTLVRAPGTLREIFDRDWQNGVGLRSFGHDIEAAFLLLDAAAALGKPHDEATCQAAHNLTIQVLDCGWDEHHAGCFERGDERGKIHDKNKMWWVQAEACHTFLLMHEKFGAHNLRYWNAFLAQWEFICARQIDDQHGGWHRVVSRRGKARRGQPKSDRWTDGYHQGRSVMNMTKILHRLARRGV